jgi:hypothetical protein
LNTFSLLTPPAGSVLTKSNTLAYDCRTVLLDIAQIRPLSKVDFFIMWTPKSLAHLWYVLAVNRCPELVHLQRIRSVY